jgi:polyhydroxyalkanoate synthase
MELTMGLFPIPSPDSLAAAGVNLRDKLVHGRLADLRRMPSSVVDDTPLRVLHRYLPSAIRADGPPVLLVPPLAAPAFAFDLRRGGSLVEHLLLAGRRVYLVDYGPIRVEDGKLGVEFWIDDVLPTTIRSVAADSGSEDVHLVGWCLGGIFSLLATAAEPSLPVRSVTAIASPFDLTAVPMVAPLRPLAAVAGGSVTALLDLLASVPAPVVSRAFQLTGFDKYVMRPVTLLAKLDDRDFLEQVEAVDHLMQNMYSYPGRLFGQLYHQMFRANDLSDGHLDVAGRRVLLADVKVPALLVGGTDDVLAPANAVRRGAELLTGSPQVRFETAPGGHLGVLTGRKARSGTWQYLDAFLAAN